MMDDSNAFLFKCILIGNSGVGKTCLARRFIQGEFPVNKGATIGVDFMMKPMLVNNIKVNLQLWDTAGQERFRAITQSYYRSAHCLILIYDVSSQPSFDSLPQWCRDIDNYTTSPIDGSTNVLKVLLGNKCDKECEIPSAVGQQFAKTYNFDLFYETSALQTTDRLDKLFENIAQCLVQRKLETMSDAERSNNNIFIGKNQNGQNDDDNNDSNNNNSSNYNFSRSFNSGTFRLTSYNWDSLNRTRLKRRCCDT